MSELIIPIFPLPIVVCPGEPIPLNIFEERYKRLVKDCYDYENKQATQAFGIVFLDNKDLSNIGCTVEIKEISQTNEGQFEIISIGIQRFKVIETILPDENIPYLSAKVELLNDHDVKIDLRLQNELKEMYLKITKLYNIESHDLTEPISFTIAFLCQIEYKPKQLLLETNNENERLEILIDFFKKIITSKEVNRRVKSNGHFKNGQIDVL